MVPAHGRDFHRGAVRRQDAGPEDQDALLVHLDPGAILAKKAGAPGDQDPVPGKRRNRLGDHRHDRPGQIAVDGGLERGLDDGPSGQRALGMGEAGGLLHFEWARALQELLISGVVAWVTLGAKLALSRVFRSDVRTALCQA